jgi:hypothetical protein
MILDSQAETVILVGNMPQEREPVIKKAVTPFDREKLHKLRDSLERLRENGLTPKEYDLVPPFGGRRVGVIADFPQTVILPKRRR